MAAPNFTDFVDTVTGTMSPEAYARLPQVDAPKQDAYQIGGLGDYTSQIGALQNRVPGAPDLSGATQGAMQNQQAIQAYLQRVGMGQERTAADAMFDTGAAQNARQAQSAAVSAGGMNPALAMRQILGAQSAGLGSLAGQSAQQKLQEQQAAMHAAGDQNQHLYQMQFQNAQQSFQNNMASISQTAQLADKVFQANHAQTGYNVQYQQNQQAFQMWQRQQQQAQQQAQSAAMGKFIAMGLNVAGQVGAGIATGGLSSMGGAARSAAGAGSALSGSGQALDNVYKGGGVNPSWNQGAFDRYYGSPDVGSGNPDDPNGRFNI